jgi:hypothetical protein
MLVLPPKAKLIMASSLMLISIIMDKPSLSMLSEREIWMISFSFSLIVGLLDKGLARLRDQLLRDGGTTIVYSYGGTAGEMGVLKAGKVLEGDQVVFVPGCFHNLLLRSREHTTASSAQWKLVGLIDMSTTITQGRRSYSESEWARLHGDGALNEYSIE